LQPIRTAAEISAHTKILPARQSYLYQKLSRKATQLRLLGMSYQEIARSLNINRKTARKACEYQRREKSLLSKDEFHQPNNHRQEITSYSGLTFARHCNDKIALFRGLNVMLRHMDRS